MRRAKAATAGCSSVFGGTAVTSTNNVTGGDAMPLSLVETAQRWPCRSPSLPTDRRKITARSKNPPIRDDRCARGGPDNPDTADGLEPLTCLLRAMLRNDPFLERSDHRPHSLRLRR